MLQQLRSLLSTPLLRNLSWMTAATFVTSVMSFLVTMYVAKVLGPENYGKVGFAHAFGSYFFAIASMGLSTLGIRDMARKKDPSASIVTTIMVLRPVLFLVSYTLIYTFISLFPRDPVTNAAVLIYALSFLLTPINYEWYDTGREQFNRIGISRIANGIAYLAAVYLLVHNSTHTLLFVSIQVAINLVPLAFLLPPVFARFQLSQFSWTRCNQYLKAGAMLMTSTIMVAVYANIDKVMLGYWYPMEQVGWYEAAYKIILVFLIPFGILWSVVTPRLARKEPNGIKLFLWLMGASGVGSFVIVFFGRHLLIDTIYGADYAPAAAPLAILALVLLATHASRAFVSPLQVWGCERAYMYIVGAGAVANIVLNFIFIPLYQTSGAAFATLCSEILVAVLAYRPFRNGLTSPC